MPRPPVTTDCLRLADAGQMHLYLNYARAPWTHVDENPPVGLILCSSAGQSLVREYRLALSDEKRLTKELEDEP